MYNQAIKASPAEGFIQMIKQMIRHFLMVTQGSNYKKYLCIIVDRYNESPHKALFCFAPEQVNLDENILIKKKIETNFEKQFENTDEEYFKRKY